MTDSLPKKSNEDQLDVARIHLAIDDALSILVHKGSREEDFDLQVELALRTIKEELEKLKQARRQRP